MEHAKVDEGEYARQSFLTVIQIGWNVERECWEEKAVES
jgi:hypothetical protein